MGLVEGSVAVWVSGVGLGGEGRGGRGGVRIVGGEIGGDDILGGGGVVLVGWLDEEGLVWARGGWFEVACELVEKALVWYGGCEDFGGRLLNGEQLLELLTNGLRFEFSETES